MSSLTLRRCKKPTKCAFCCAKISVRLVPNRHEGVHGRPRAKSGSRSVCHRPPRYIILNEMRVVNVTTVRTPLTALLNDGRSARNSTYDTAVGDLSGGEGQSESPPRRMASVPGLVAVQPGISSAAPGRTIRKARAFTSSVRVGLSQVLRRQSPQSNISHHFIEGGTSSTENVSFVEAAVAIDSGHTTSGSFIHR